MQGTAAPTQAPARHRHWRPLTQGEIRMARLIFRDAIDYSKVKVHGHKWPITLGLQPRDTAVTPNGQIYFPKDNFKDDFYLEKPWLQGIFIHEMAHVWQRQLKYPVARKRIFHPFMNYDYVLNVNYKICDYNMEEQGDILADYFILKYQGPQLAIRNPSYKSTPNLLQLMSTILSNFIANPSNPANLPAR